MPLLDSIRGRISHGTSYIPQLDGLRALAVSSVLLLHFHPHPGPVLSFLGHQAVRLFFVLSGFLITGILLKSSERVHEKSQNLREALRIFYLRRALRIFPPYYATLAILVFRGPPEVISSLPWHLTYTTNFLIARLKEWPQATAHLWSLAVEEQFYIVWPLVVLLTPRRRLVLVVLATLLVGVSCQISDEILHLNEFAVVLTPFALDALAVGALLAIIGHRRHLRILFATGTGVAFIGFFFRGSDMAWILWESGLPCFYALIISLVCTDRTGWSQKVLCIKPLRYLGKISYGVYLYHLPLAWLFGRTVERGARIGAFVSPEVYHIGAYSAITIAVASLSWFFFERPILALKDRFQYEDGEVALRGRGVAPSLPAI